MEKYEVNTFKNDLVQIDVNVSPNEETMWLTLNQISELFGRDKSVISRHIIKIFEEEELEKEIAKIKPKSEIFYKGQYFESNLFVKNIVNDAV